IYTSLDLHLAGTVEVTLSGVFTATAAGSVDLGQRVLADAPADAVAVAAGLSGTGLPVEATVVALQSSGSGGGISASVSVNLVSLSQGANSWLGVEATGISLSLALDPLLVSVTNGALKLNRAAGAGTHKLDWDSFTEGADPTPLAGVPLPHLNIDTSLDLHLAGTVEVTLSGVFTATAAGSVDLGQLVLAD